MGSCKGLHLQGRADRTGDPILACKVFHAMHVILSLKLGDYEGLALFNHGQLLPASCPACHPDAYSDPCIPESSSLLLLSPVQDFLVLPGSHWRNASLHGTSPGNSLLILYILFYLFYY